MTPTPEQLDRVRKWCERNGKDPHCLEPCYYVWFCLYGTPDDRHFINARLPPSLFTATGCGTRSFRTAEAALSALALALAELDAVVGVAEIAAEAKREERERCAGIAQHHRAVDKYREQYGWPHAQREIADAIRKGASS